MAEVSVSEQAHEDLAGIWALPTILWRRIAQSTRSLTIARPTPISLNWENHARNLAGYQTKHFAPIDALTSMG